MNLQGQGALILGIDAKPSLGATHITPQPIVAYLGHIGATL